jgi:F-type H+-transporting ATPase subunit b
VVRDERSGRSDEGTWLDRVLTECYAPTLLAGRTGVRQEKLSLLASAGGAIQLVPDGTLLFHLALIVVMVGLLNATLLKPVNRVLEERERRTRGRIGEAQKILAIAEEKMLEYERRLREARVSGYTLLEEQRSAASQERERRVSGVKAEVIRWRDEEKERLKRDEVAVKAGLMKDARKRAYEIGVRILGRHLRTPKH